MGALASVRVGREAIELPVPLQMVVRCAVVAVGLTVRFSTRADPVRATAGAEPETGLAPATGVVAAFAPAVCRVSEVMLRSRDMPDGRCPWGFALVPGFAGLTPDGCRISEINGRSRLTPEGCLPSAVNGGGLDTFGRVPLTVPGFPGGG